MNTIEPLESRRLLSVNTLTLSGTGGLTKTGTGTLVLSTWGTDSVQVTSKGTLVIKGSDAAETITVERRDGRYHVGKGGGLAVSFDGNAVRRVLIEANGGDDRVGIATSLDRTPVTIAGGAGDDTISGSLGDTLIGGGGNDVLSVPTLLGYELDEVAVAPPALLSGGADDDTLVAGGFDSVVGGTGEDLAIFRIRSLTVINDDGECVLGDD